MSEDTETSKAHDEAEPTVEQVVTAGPDRSLAKLVTLVNVAGEETRIPLVLVVQGQVIGGDLIGGQFWFQKLTEQFVSASAQHGEELRPLFAGEEALYSDTEAMHDGF